MNKWTEDVAELSEQFQKSTALVAKWDRAIVLNEDRIHAVHKDAQSLQIAHKELTNNLDVILSQQSELHNLLDSLEEDVERKIGSTNSSGSGALPSSFNSTKGLKYESRLFSNQFPYQNAGRSSLGGRLSSSSNQSSGANRIPGDIERETMHKLSVEVMEELDAMALTIRDLVQDLNKGRDGSGIGDGGGDVVSQIIAVLNAHLDSLMYLDESSSALQKRLTDVSRAVEVISRDSERMYGGRRSGGSLY